MNLCDDGHSEVCYEGRNCPVCEISQQLQDAEDLISILKEEKEALIEETKDLAKQIP